VEITTHDFFTALHGMGFGALFMLAFSGALVELYRISAPGVPSQISPNGQRLLGFYLGAMVILAWLTVLSGTYQIYPWYRAVPPAGVTDLAEYPRRLLLSTGRTSQWHNLGMEWKEHAAWLAPIAITMVAYVTMKYGREIIQHKNMRIAVLAFAVAAFAATGIAGAFGAFLNKYAPIKGGQVIILMGEGK
jgi:xanthosine utilization system XapX-like protein